MRRLAAALVSLAMLVAPAAGAAFPGQPRVHPYRNHIPRKVARQACLTERRQLGVAAFRLKYGAPHALASCVKAKLPTTFQATATCLAQRKSLGVAAFREMYPGRNAIRVCVRLTVAG